MHVANGARGSISSEMVRDRKAIEASVEWLNGVRKAVDEVALTLVLMRFRSTRDGH